MLRHAVRVIAVALVAGWGVLGTVFINGEMLTDPGGWQAVGLLVMADVPLFGLGWLALRRPAVAARVLPLVVTVVGGLVLVDELADITNRYGAGPVHSIALFVVAVPCGLLGVHMPGRAGVLLLAIASVAMLSTVSRWDREAGQGFGSALSGSTGAQAVPCLLFAVLFLTLHVLERPYEEAGHPRIRSTARA